MNAENDRVKEYIEAEQYEDAFGVSLDAVPLNINKAHIRALHSFADDTETQIALNKAKSLLAKENKTDKSRRFSRIGTQLSADERNTEALRYLMQAVALDPDPMDYHLIGVTLVRLSRAKEAVPYLITAVALDPNPYSLSWLSNTLIGLKRYEEALPYIRDLVKTEPNANSVFLLGMTLSELNRDEEAIPYLKRAVESRGNAADCAWLGASLTVLGRYDEALPHLSKAVEMRGNEGDYRWLRDCQDAIRFRETRNIERQSELSFGGEKGSGGRVVCGDAACTGIIGTNGRCSVCGRTIKEGEQADRDREQARRRGHSRRNSAQSETKTPSAADNLATKITEKALLAANYRQRMFKKMYPRATKLVKWAFWCLLIAGVIYLIVANDTTTRPLVNNPPQPFSTGDTYARPKYIRPLFAPNGAPWPSISGYVQRYLGERHRVYPQSR